MGVTFVLKTSRGSQDRASDKAQFEREERKKRVNEKEKSWREKGKVYLGMGAMSDMAGDGMEKGWAGKERNDGIYILMRVVAVYKSLDPF